MRQNPNCDICRGSGVIRLPVYRQISVRDVQESATMPLGEASRAFACPECGSRVVEDNVRLLGVSLRADRRRGDFGWEHTKRDMAHSLVEEMIRDGLVQFSERNIRHDMTVEIRATVGVVSTRTVVSMTQRIRERQMEIATSLTVAAKRAIANWGSRYTDDSGSIPKAQAISAVIEALQQVETEESANHDA